MLLSENLRCLKQKGDIELKSGNYQQAWKLYTDALEMINKIYEIDKYNGIEINNEVCDLQQEAKILSKRSVVLLKMNKYYYAHQDAKQITSINPGWFKGYLRMANIELECGLFHESLKNYHLAMRYINLENKEDHRNRYESFVNQSIKHILLLMHRERIYDYQLTWVATAIGMVTGMAVVCWDFVAHRNNSYFHHPLIKLIVIASCSVIFYYLSYLRQYFSKKFKENLLSSPRNEKTKIE